MSQALVGILLAAGKGSRFGSDKLLHPLPDGTPMAIAAAVNLLHACGRVIAVVRNDNETLSRLLSLAGCETVICTAADSGMGHSLAAGVNATPDASGWVVALADMPFIAPSSHHAVIACLNAGAILAATEFNGHRGHPVGFAKKWFDQLSQLAGDYGGKPILEAHHRELALCTVNDPGVLRDIDRPEDLEINLSDTLLTVPYAKIE